MRSDPREGRGVRDLCVAWIRVVALLVPWHLRDGWVREWHAEIHYAWLRARTGDGASFSLLFGIVSHCFGAPLDAAWLRCHDWSPEMWIHDVRYAIRGLARRPGFTVVVVVILAVGIGANAAVFSVFDGVLLRPLPYPDADRLVMLWDRNVSESLPKEGPTPANLLDWRERNEVFTGVAAWYAGQPLTLQGEAGAEKVQVAQVTADFFPVLASAPHLGRTFHPDEVAIEAPVVVLRHGFWMHRFSGDPSIVGQSIVLDDVPHEVIGIAPPEFAIPNEDVALWVPWDFGVAYAHLPEVPRDYRFLRVVARLRTDVDLDRAQANMDSVAASLAADFPVNSGWETVVVPLDEEIIGDLRPALSVLFGAVAFVLMISCTNVANLAMARASSRVREIALRSALGASRLQLIRQVLTESVLLSLIGGLLGLLLGRWGLEALLALAPEGLPRIADLSLNARVLFFTFAVSVATGVVFGVVPALSGAHVDPVHALRDGSAATSDGRPRQRFRQTLVVSQIAIALTLVVGAGLLIRSFAEILAVDPGFDPDNVLVARVFPDPKKYRTAEQRLDYFGELRTRFEGLPGVVSVGAATGLPLNAFNNTPSTAFWPPEKPPADGGGPEATLTMATAGYLRTMGTPLIEGRDFGAEDHIDAPRVTIVNRTLARQVWGRESPIGKSIVLDFPRQPYAYRVVGVAADMRTGDLRTVPRAEALLPHTQAPYATMNVVLRTAGDPFALRQLVQREILALDAGQPVHSVTSMARLVSGSLARDRFAVGLLGTLTVLALVLAASGIYSVIAYWVAQRTRELGVRIALGASRRDLIRMVIGQGGRLGAMGVLVGIVVAFGMSRAMSALLFGIRATDPLTYAMAAALLAVVVFVASGLPAFRATRVDPARALRSE